MENTTSYFAEIGEDNLVKRVLCLNTVDFLDDDGIEQEEIGAQKIKEIASSDLVWKRCWVDANGDLGKRFAYPAVDSFYDESLDIFYGAPWERGWVFNTESLQWEPPSDAPPKPTLTQEQIDEGYVYVWVYTQYYAGENPWKLYFVKPMIPSELELTYEEGEAGGFHYWNHEQRQWEKCFVVGEPPELTEQQISEGYDYTWDEDAHRNGEPGWNLIQRIDY